jgi:hypothetical protein
MKLTISCMKRLPHLPAGIPIAVVALAAAAIFGGFVINTLAEDTKAETKADAKPDTKADQKIEDKAAEKPKAEKKLTGAELYAVHCNRCHPERYPTEFTSAQWQTIMLHMRVRANLPADQAKEILKYMKEEAGK